jgi:hypothetical protein
LEPYRYFEPADFEGSYKTCFATAIRKAADSQFDGSYHLCENDPYVMSIQNFTKIDDYGAYQSTSEGVPEEGIDLGSFQGIANGNTLPMAAFGPGINSVNFGNGTYLLPNDSPDSRTCTMFAGKVMKCVSFYSEYCTGVLENGTSSCEEGQTWLNTYAIEKILVLDGDECPEAPAADFCGTYNPNRRGLQDESGSGSVKKTACPFLAEKMD